ncbi:DeoR family transcriptional regulator [Sinomonas cyclohexanicum]|uniref:DeoR family transcriptional regulator n=1 Tax=Sinomonas cyclohexanicum TaxID=322009 RepID=A0ABN6FPK6_SINCY|nr:YafY family protein [Corynebacterium cyclohexanicum]BCT77941.1 DeoR family transcriptional regulator [Corynebacterium cyclohexanicum]
MNDTTQRVLSLLNLLQSRPVWTGTELAERLGVTTRSIRRDIERLRELGYPVRAEHGTGGGYQLGAGKALPPLLLDDEEAVAVAVSLRLAAGGTVAGLGEAAVRSLAKLDQVLPARLRAEVKGVIDATVSLDGPVTSVDADVLVALARAIRTPERATFDYTKPGGERSERRVEPYRLVAAARRWYLMAWDLDREDWRTFRLDRMAAARGTGWRFKPRESPDAVEYVQASITQAPYQFVAKVRVHAPAHEVAERVPTTMAVVEPDAEHGGEASILTAGADDLDYVAYHVVRLGWPVTVIEPPELRDAMRVLAERLTAAGA